MINPVELNFAMRNNAVQLFNEDISELESAVMERHGIPKVVAASEFDRFSENQRKLLMVKHGLYVFPTLELAEFLDEMVVCKTVLEIGAGNGVMADHLGIRATDNYSQSPDYRPDPKLRALWVQGQEAMAKMGQACVTYGTNVERIEAMDAVIKHKPEIVYGQFITHKYRAGDKDGNKFGVDEEKLLRRCEYVMVGNLVTHQNKRILSLPHETYELPGLVTRAMSPAANRIWKWNKL